MEERKRQERDFHNLVREEKLKNDPSRYDYFWSNRKFYSIAVKSREFVEQWLKPRIQGKKVLDYCSGNGLMSIWLAKNGAAETCGIDISDVSVVNSQKAVGAEGLQNRCRFSVMDGEKMTFEDDSFDLIYERGVLHHLDLEKAYSELSRTLKPDGACLCVEALKHNPVMQWYRRKTPQLRTSWEVDHILGRDEIALARKFFNHVEVLGCFYLFALLAVPFRNTRFFNPLLRFLEAVDHLVLRLPWIKWQAWHVVFSLEQPRK
ncbi:MAG: class I SAM-dependent methyltransferase [Deltaproteobacteria bacterium]|nr:class I SAM-dependent methyltransferase [Deltaproteobacteria bacterium]MBI2500854.1 class I SAM-dependent methyltransferase [Deltaproteobacteria bacterium]MBI4196880.1 class I SAM-dependent methyltransferase [Deltaproteobacteria bacterium]